MHLRARIRRGIEAATSLSLLLTLRLIATDDAYEILLSVITASDEIPGDSDRNAEMKKNEIVGEEFETNTEKRDTLNKHV